MASRYAEPLLKRIAIRGMDATQRILIRRRMLPPFSMRRFVGEASWELEGRNFESQGRHFTAKLIEDTGLNAESLVLDPGIDFAWKGRSPISGQIGDHFAVR